MHSDKEKADVLSKFIVSGSLNLNSRWIPAEKITPSIYDRTEAGVRSAPRNHIGTPDGENTPRDTSVAHHPLF